MLFLHIIDDFKLQTPTLSNLKQKTYWEEHAPDEMYTNDYLCALLIHAFSWTFMIMLPIMFINNFELNIAFMYMFISNIILHAFIDNEKANKRTINLWQDQTVHLIQIILTANVLN